jgi:hypothetical protein
LTLSRRAHDWRAAAGQPDDYRPALLIKNLQHIWGLDQPACDLGAIGKSKRRNISHTMSRWAGATGIM